MFENSLSKLSTESQPFCDTSGAMSAQARKSIRKTKRLPPECLDCSDTVEITLSTFSQITPMCLRLPVSQILGMYLGWSARFENLFKHGIQATSIV